MVAESVCLAMEIEVHSSAHKHQFEILHGPCTSVSRVVLSFLREHVSAKEDVHGTGERRRGTLDGDRYQQLQMTPSRLSLRLWCTLVLDLRASAYAGSFQNSQGHVELPPKILHMSFAILLTGHELFTDTESLLTLEPACSKAAASLGFRILPGPC